MVFPYSMYYAGKHGTVDSSENILAHIMLTPNWDIINVIILFDICNIFNIYL